MARSWGITPSEFWDMTMAEIMVESQVRGDTAGGSYAGGLTRGELDEMAAADAALREKRKQARVTASGTG